MLCYDCHDNREDWLNARSGIGASDAAAVIGASKWQTPVGLWNIKTGKVKPKDLSDNENVSYGVKAEPCLRGLFMAKHPELELKYRPYDILFQDNRPWMTCTLDGELTETATGRRGILEIKTSTPNSKAAWAEWKDQIPRHYFAQVLHQLIVTEWDFVYLSAELIGMSGDSTIREYCFDRSDYEDDMAWLLEEETKFWGYVERRQVLPVPLDFIL